MNCRYCNEEIPTNHVQQDGCHMNCADKIIKIPETNCDACRFYGENEDGDRHCAIYNKMWVRELDEEDDDFSKPTFCKATAVKVMEG